MSYKSSPSSGSVFVDYIFSWYGMYGASAYTGSDTTTPLGVLGYNSGTSTTPSVTVTSESSNSLLVDSMYNDTNEATATGTGQTRLYSQIGSGGSSAFRLSSSYTTGTGGSQTVSYSLSASKAWEIEVAEIKPAAGGGGGGTPAPDDGYTIYN